MRHRQLIVLLAACSLSTAVGAAAASDIWTLTSGRTTVHLNVEHMKAIGLDVQDIHPTAMNPAALEINLETPYWSFEMAPATSLTFQVDQGKLISNALRNGSLSHSGDFSIQTANGSVADFDGFVIAFTPAPSIRAGLSMRSASSDLPIFDLLYPHMQFFAETNELVLGSMDVTISEEWASALRRPELAGHAVGMANIRGTAVFERSVPGGPSEYTPTNADAIDVKLGILESIQEVGHEGTFPNGTDGISMSTTSCNVGTIDVPWQQAMDEDHPSIAMCLFREMNGRFEQVGISDMKHGFFALSNSQCTPCQNPSDGTFLGVGCSDTYGVSNNADRNWLAPRSEIDPHKAQWTCLASHFAGGQPDCVRRHGGSGHTAAQHRLAVKDSELGNAGATYYYEANYIVEGDGNLQNNIGSRRCTMSWGGSSWSFSTPNSGNALVEGPAINRWGDMQTTVNNGVTGDGRVVLAVKTVDLGNGFWSYEYALYNWSSERRVRRFTVPVSTTVQNIGFHDYDGAGANDWAVTVDGTSITWECETIDVNPNAPALEFGTLNNFRFETDSPPILDEATIYAFQPSGIGAPETQVAINIPEPNITAVPGDDRQGFVRLAQNAPNPLAPTTTIRFELEKNLLVSLDVYDTSGRLIRNLTSTTLHAGSHAVEWDGRGLDGQRVASGQYYYRLTAGDFTAVRSMLILR